MKLLFHRPDRKKRDDGATDGYRDVPPSNADWTLASPASTPLPLPERLTPRTDRPSSTPSIPALDPHRREPETVSTSTNVAKKDCWQLAIDKLKEEDPSTVDQIAAIQQVAAETGSTDFAAQLLHVTTQSHQALEAKGWKITTSAGEVVLRDELDRILKVATVFKDVGNAAGSLDPVHAGLPLAGFCVLMQVWPIPHFQ